MDPSAHKMRSEGEEFWRLADNCRQRLCLRSGFTPARLREERREDKGSQSVLGRAAYPDSSKTELGNAMLAVTHANKPCRTAGFQTPQYQAMARVYSSGQKKYSHPGVG